MAVAKALVEWKIDEKRYERQFSVACLPEIDPGSIQYLLVEKCIQWVRFNHQICPEDVTCNEIEWNYFT
jgi:hypothetical protein